MIRHATITFDIAGFDAWTMFGDVHARLNTLLASGLPDTIEYLELNGQQLQIRLVDRQ